MVRIFISSLVVATSLVGMSGQAAALVIAPSFTVGLLQPEPCGGPAAVPGSGAPSSALALVPQITKAAAILGGRMSALERMQQEQQTQLAAPTSVQTQIATGPASATMAGGLLVPGIGGAGCNRFSLPLRGAPPVGVKRPGSDDFLLTRRLPVSRTAFDAEWGRVNRAVLTPGAVNRLLPAHLRGARADLGAVEQVNVWTNRRIRYVEDAKLFGAADHWSEAAATLRRKAGDCEDIAIVKMQVLAGLGVPRSDMYLTITRDLARHADHALLVVRIADRYWVLDNATDRVLDANMNLDYQPVLSFNGDRKWLHGAVQLASN